MRRSSNSIFSFSRILTFLFYKTGSCLHDLMNWVELWFYNNKNTTNRGKAPLRGWHLRGPCGGFGGLCRYRGYMTYLKHSIYLVHYERELEAFGGTMMLWTEQVSIPGAFVNACPAQPNLSVYATDLLGGPDHGLIRMHSTSIPTLAKRCREFDI